MTRRVSLAVLVAMLPAVLLGYELTSDSKPASSELAESVSTPALGPVQVPPPTTTTSTTLAPSRKTTTTRASRAASRPAPQPATGNWAALINQYPWDTAKAQRIMMCESGGNPNAINRRSGATGLFQIHPGGSKYLDPATNVATAYAKYKAAGGWSPWVCKG